MTILNKVSNRTMMPGITPIPDVPDAPTIGTATDPGTDGYATVAFTPAVTGGTVANYTATSTPGSITATSATSPITVTGLTVNTSYTFKVKGTNATATGPESAASSSFTPTPHNSYESIQTVTVGVGGQSSISFTSIPSTYKHLQLRGLLRTNRGLAYDSFNLTANGGTSYSCHVLEGDGGGATAAGAGSQTSINYNNIAGNGGTASSFAAIVLDVLDYSNVTTNKTFRYLHGYDLNGSGKISLASGAALSTSAISSLTFVPQNSSLFVQYSTIALYGIK